MAEALPGEMPLSGRTIGVTADRKAGELIDALRRKGCDVVHGPAMRSVQLADDETVRADTEAFLADPPDIAVITTGVGFRGWREAAAGWGLAERFDAAFARLRLVVRGPKARGASRAAGLTEEFSAPEETNAELLDYLREQGVDGLNVALQQHGEPMPEFADALRAAGATVREVCVYRWAPPLDFAPLDRLITETVAGRLDAVTFTSAPAVGGMLGRAADTDRGAELLAALRGPVAAFCVGPVTAAPLTERDVPVRQPARARTGALVRFVAEELGPR